MLFIGVASLLLPIIVTAAWLLTLGAAPRLTGRTAWYVLAGGICLGAVIAGAVALVIIWSGREQGEQYDSWPVMYTSVVIGNGLAGLFVTGLFWLLRPEQHSAERTRRRPD